MREFHQVRRFTSSFLACQQADLVFVLDVSNSIGSRANFEKGLQFVNKIIDLYEIGEDLTRVGVATFAEDAELRFKLNQFKTKNDIMNALNQIPYPVKGKGEATLIYRGLNMAKSTLLSSKNGARDNVPDIVVVITDGETRPRYIQQEVGKAKTQKEASMLRKMGAAVFAIGVSDNVDKDELTGMVGGKGERYLKADTYEELNTEIFFKDIKYKLCREQCKGKKMDIAFVLDQSSSLHEEKNFKKELSFVTDVVERISMSNDETRVAVVKFSTNAILEVPLNMYHDAQKLKKKVLTISWEGGETYLRKAIDMVVDRVFKAANGARSDAEKLVVVITDGVSKERVRTKEAIKRLHGMGTNVFAIGVGPDVDMKELEKISTNSQYYKVDNINALDSVQSILNDQVCPNNTEHSKYCKRGRLPWGNIRDLNIKTLHFGENSRHKCLYLCKNAAGEGGLTKYLDS
ncbi:hypothetical protein FSP39_015804 [Pinctada imbricata]|uniref:VWFA domain-containing protein n=1 Tax=Pinctada imbricata TaxID=66713 RepID=A0AA88XWT3_PINIB|nr:hypothetical protein FSP39_015804 [Pinctada imbricata]